MQSETGFPSSHQLKSYVASKSRLKLAARAVLSADAGLLVLLGKQSIPYVTSTVTNEKLIGINTGLLLIQFIMCLRVCIQSDKKHTILS